MSAGEAQPRALRGAAPDDQLAITGSELPQPPQPANHQPESEPARMPSGGLISAILGRGQSTDEGALAALRTLPKRATPDPDYTDPIDEASRTRARVALLEELALDKPAEIQARLLTQAAELLTQLGESQRAHATYDEAFARDPQQPLVAQQLYRRFVRSGDWEQAAQLLEKVCSVTPDARERALSLCARAQLATQLGAPSEQVIELLERATRENPSSLLAPLLLARELLQTGCIERLAQALCDTAERADLPSTRALLLLEAGRALERHGANTRALACYQQSHGLDASSSAALIGVARLQLAKGDHSAAAVTLAKLSTQEKQPELQAEWTRQRGLVLLDRLDEPGPAMKALHAQQSVTGLRALTRAAEAAGEYAEQERALGAWAQLSGGVLRGLVSAEHARARRRTQPELVLPASGHTKSSNVTQSDSALRRAAQLSTEPTALREEQRLLAGVASDDAAFVEADIIGRDVAAELADLAQLRNAVSRDVERWPEALRAGAIIAAFDLDGVDATRAEHVTLWQALGKLAQGEPVVTRYLAARAGSAQQSAQLWLGEAMASNGAHAAFAATTAGHYLEMAGADPTEAYVDALDALRGYWPAAFGLEISARSRSELSALERVHREIADTTTSRQERSARYVRLGLLNADSDLSAAAHWLRLAEQSTQVDGVLDELSIRLALDQSPAHQAELLETASERQRSPAYARAMRLQAAEAHEAAGQWDDAIRLYRAQLAQSPDDLFADCALMTSLRRRGRPQALAAELERRVNECDDVSRRAVLLEDWAQAEHAQGKAARAHALLRRAITERPSQGAVAALRALERHALQQDDAMGIMQYSQQLAEAVEERTASAAELRLCLRACRKLGADVYSPLMAAEGRVRESWYAREIEALAVRSGDRSRLYEAMWLQSELCRDHGGTERAAYALRAAEVLEQVAPARAARELADALGSAREHPFAMEQLARLLKAAGETFEAAQTFARAARISGSPPRAAALHYTAGVLFHDELDEPAQAIDNLQKAAKLDPLFADTFTRLQILLRREGRKQELLTLLATRLELPHDRRQSEQLQLERYQLLLEQHRNQDAEQALQAALRSNPDSIPALHALAGLQERAKNFAAAAQTWTKLTELIDDVTKLADAHARLGDLYRCELAEPENAEHAYQRALECAADNAAALAGLAQLYTTMGRFAQALDATSALIALDPSGSDREALVIQQALLRERVGQPTEALQALEMAQRLTPASLPLLRTHAELLQRAGADDTRDAVLMRGCNALRAAIEMDPAELRHWLGLHELLRLRGADDAAALVAHAAQVLGHSHPDLAAGSPRGLGAQALSPSVLGQIAPRGALYAIADLLRALGPALAHHLPFDYPSEPILASIARELAPPVTAEFGLGELQLSRCEPNLCLPLSAAPLQVCLGGAWLEKASDAERAFAILRAVGIAKLDLHLLTRCAPERFGLVLNALWSIADRTHMVVVLDATEQNRVATALAASLDSSQHARTKQLIDAIVEHEEINPRRLQSAALDYGARIALCTTGDLWAGLSCLLGLRGRQASTLGQSAKLELCRTDPALRGLLRFAISEAYAQARRFCVQKPAPERV